MSVHRQLSCVLLVLVLVSRRPGDGGGFPHQAHHPDLPLPGRRVHGRHRPPAGGGGRQDPGPARAGRKQRRRRRGRGHRAPSSARSPTATSCRSSSRACTASAHINKLSFDTVKDVTPIIRVGGYLYGVLVRPDSKIKTLPELIQAAKAKPGQLTYMASGHRHRRPHRRRGDGRERRREVQPPAVQGRPGVLGLAARRPRRFHLDHLGLDPAGRGRAAEADRRPTATRASSASRTSRR